MGKWVTAAMSAGGLQKKASVIVALSVMTVLVIVGLQLYLLTEATPRTVLFRLAQRWEGVQRQYQPVLVDGHSNLPYPNRAVERIQNPPSSVFTEPPQRVNNDTHLKKILFWNDDYVNKHFEFGFGREPFLLGGCRVNTCITTGDRNRYPIEEIDAVIWHLMSSDKSLPKRRYYYNVHGVF